MSDLEDYVGDKVVNGHCDCMFLINTFQWPWTQIAALIVPRPMLFENSGHDTIFPMNGNDRIRARLEKLYSFYTNRTDRLFDIGVTPGGHDDKPELRLMAYRWINHFLKGDDSPVTEPDLPKIDGKDLRAFPDELPSDEINTRIDESFVPTAIKSLPKTAADLTSWREAKMAELRRVVLRPAIATTHPPVWQRLDATPSSGSAITDGGIGVPYQYFRSSQSASTPTWEVILGETDSLDSRPDWLTKILGEASVLMVATRGSGPLRVHDPAPYYYQRALPLLGRTADSERLADFLWVTDGLTLGTQRKLVGRGQAGIIAAYAALLRTNVSEVVLVDPPTSHRDGPIFLNVLRVLDIPEALGLLAPRALTICTPRRQGFEDTAKIYALAGAPIKFQPLP